jgi:hypothetical protein
MSEADEVAASIYEKHTECWPLTRKQAEALAWVYLHHESQQVQDSVADALMELNPK